MIAHLCTRDTPIARGLLVLLPLAFASALIALAGTSATEPEAVADAAPASGARAGLEGAALESPRIASMLEIHDDQQALLYGRSAPGAEFVVYANNLECARDTADADGWWVVRVQMTALIRGVVAPIPRTLRTSGLLLVEGWSSSTRRFRLSRHTARVGLRPPYRSNAERLRISHAGSTATITAHRPPPTAHRPPHGGGGGPSPPRACGQRSWEVQPVADRAVTNRGGPPALATTAQPEAAAVPRIGGNDRE